MMEEIDYNSPPPKAVYNFKCIPVEGLEKLKAKLRRKALKEAARAVCKYCANNRPGGRNWEGVYHHEDVNGLHTVDCKAAEIHKLLSAKKKSIRKG